MSIVDDYNNARGFFLSHFDTTRMQVFELVDSTEYFWLLTDDAIHFGEDIPSDPDDWMYCEERASNGMARGEDFTLISVHECTGTDCTMILDNRKECGYE